MNQENPLFIANLEMITLCLLLGNLFFQSTLTPDQVVQSCEFRKELIKQIIVTARS